MSHLKTIVPALILFGFVLSAGVAQADYQNIIDFTLSNYQDDDGDEIDTNTLAYFYFFNPVDTSQGPLFEAAFIQRAGYIGAATSRSESDYGTVTADGSTHSATLEIANPTSPFLFGINYSQGDSDYQGVINYSSETKMYRLSVGYFIEKYTLLTLGHTKYETNYRGIPASYKFDSNDISVKKLFIQENGNALSLSGNYSVTEDNDGDQSKILAVSGTYYPDTHLGLGLYLGKNTGDNKYSDSKTVGLFASLFLNSRFQLGANYFKHMADDPSEADSSQILLNASFLF